MCKVCYSSVMVLRYVTEYRLTGAAWHDRTCRQDKDVCTKFSQSLNLRTVQRTGNFVIFCSTFLRESCYIFTYLLKHTFWLPIQFAFHFSYHVQVVSSGCIVIRLNLFSSGVQCIKCCS